jgi:hypothetical protein
MAFSNFGINGNHFKAGKLSLADDVNNGETAVVTSSAQGTVQVTTSQLTASYAKIDTLDVNTINSVTTTETTLEVSDAKIIAGLSASSGVNGLQIGGSSTDTELASVLYDGSNLDLNLAGTTYAALSTSKFEVQGVISGSGQLQGASVAVDGAVTATSASLGTVMGSAAQLSGDLRLEGALTMDNVTISNAGAIAGATTISGSSTLSGHALDIEADADIDGTLNVAGAATLQSTLSAQSASFTTVNGTGAAQFDSTMIVQDDLTVGGQATLQDTLDVAGAATLQNTLSAQSASFTTIYGSGAAQIAGALRLESELTMDNASISDAGVVSGSRLESGVVQSGQGPSYDGETMPQMLFQMMTASLNDASDVNGGEFRFRIPDGDSPQMNRFVIGAWDGSEDTDRLTVEKNALIFNGDTTVSDGFTLSSQNCEADRLHGAEGLLISATNENNYDEEQNITIDRLGTGRVFRFRDNANEEAGSNSIIATFSSASAGGLDIDLVAGSISNAVNIDGSGDLTMGSITMAEFTVDASGNTDIDGTINVEGAATLQSTLTAQSASFTTVYGSGAAQFDSTMIVQDDLTVGGSTTLQDTLAVSGESTFGGGYGSTGATISDAGVLSIDGQFNHAAGIIPAVNGSQNIGSADYRYNAVYANNVYTGDFHMKNERGDWTLFEESDHIRIRNNKTGQTFKLGMSLIEE